MTTQPLPSPWLIAAAVLFWIPALGIDSVAIAQQFADGQLITTMMVLSVYSLMFWRSDRELRLKMLVMVPLSWLGEVLCCVVMDLYDYRLGNIPIFVPFGHAVIFTTGVWLSRTPALLNREAVLKRWMPLAYALLFVFVAVALNDTLSALCAILFFLGLHRKNYCIFYLLMSALVLYLELVGTWFGSWLWDQEVGILHTVNPPVGAMFIYIGGDMLLTKLCAPFNQFSGQTR